MRTPPQDLNRETQGKLPGSLVPSVCVAVCCLILFSGMPARTQNNPTSDGRWAVLVTGISGEPGLQKEYLQELVNLRGLLEGPLGFPPSHVIALFDDPKLDPARIQYQSNRENLEKVCRDIAGRGGEVDTLFVFLEGHGDADGKMYRLNLVGPDPTSVELAAMFYAIPAQRYVIVNATNCSGASLEALAGKGKIIISATRSGNEKNLTHLGRYFIEALVDNNADVDKNGRVSMFEAYSYAARKVEERYTKEGSMQSEHPMLSDNGDAQALSLADAGTRSTLLSRSAYLDRGSPLLLQADMSPEAQALAKEAQSLEKQVEQLKSIKDEIPEAEYEKRLEALLLKLAEVQAKLRKK
ncbi:MAG: hypothetical protein LAP85_02745 [Acidobacteriia bacterium]|nr:hypothetical protein [Terriglobia bacterium]